MAVDGVIRINTKINSSDFNKGISSMTGMVGKLVSTLGVVFGVGGLVAFGKKSVAVAIEAEAGWQGLRYLVQAYGRDIKQVEKFIQEYTKDGLVPLMNAQNSYRNLLARGYETNQIEEMLEIFKNSAVYLRRSQYEIGDSIEATTMGFRTERSILSDAAGIQQNLFKMWQAYTKETGTTISNMTLAEKRLAEYNAVIQEGGIYMGAAAQYSETYAGKVAQLSAAMLSFKIAVGNAVIPVLNSILPYIINLVNWLTRLFNIIGRVMNLLFGTNVGMKDAQAGMKDDAQGQADAMGKVADNTEKAGKAAKGALASFDKLNVLSQPSGGSGGAPKDGLVAGGGMEMPPLDTEQPIAALDNLEKKILAIKAKLAEFFAPFKDPMAKLHDSWKNLKDAVGDALAPLFQDEDGSRATFITEVRDGVIPIILALANALNWLADEINKNPDAFRFLTVLIIGIAVAFLLASSPILGIIFLIGILAVAVALATKHWNEHKDVIIGLLIVLGIVLAVTAGIPALILAIGLAIGIVAVLVAKNLETIKAKFQEVADKIASLFNGMGDWFRMSVTEPIAYWFSILAENIAKIFNTAWTNVINAWSGAGTWFTDNVIEPIGDAFRDTLEWLGREFTTQWNNIKSVWELVSDWFYTNVINPIRDGFLDALDKISDKWGSVWGGLKDLAVSAFNSAIDAINGFLSGIEASINFLVSGFNSLGGKIPGWKILDSVSISKIPYLATGTVAPPNAPFFAVLGDNRREHEVVSPLSTMKQAFAETMQEFGGMGNIRVPVYLDSQVLFEANVNAQRRRGTSLIARAT